MKYYKVKKEYDQRTIYKYKGNYRIPFTFLVADELYTEKELEKIGIRKDSRMFDAVEVSRKKIYWFFGCRFQTEETTQPTNKKGRFSF